MCRQFGFMRARQLTRPGYHEVALESNWRSASSKRIPQAIPEAPLIPTTMRCFMEMLAALLADFGKWDQNFQYNYVFSSISAYSARCLGSKFAVFGGPGPNANSWSEKV